MFEREAKEYVPNINWHAYSSKEIREEMMVCYQKGAEFGYNKVNEWHYMKDVECYEDLPSPPEEKDRILIWKVQVFDEKGIKQPVCYHCGSFGDLWYEVNAYHVIAWKEIVPPKEIDK